MIRPLPYGVKSRSPTLTERAVIFATYIFRLLTVTFTSLQLFLVPDDLIAQFKY